MKKMIKIVGSIGITMMLLGAGCNEATNTEEQSSQQTPVQNQENPSSSVQIEYETVPDSEQNSTEENKINLNAEAQGNGVVKFTWSTEEKLNDTNRFIILRGNTENPENTGKNFWTRIFYTQNEVAWSGQPTGTWHYRICLTKDNQNDKCVYYSNDVTVDVQ